MSKQFTSIVEFKGDRLFNGAVNIDWFQTDPIKAIKASEAFVFHGPDYHGVNQEDIGENHSHKLVDTASFARIVAKRSFGLEEQPFTLAIAGYGTGKSHLGLTLAKLFDSPSSSCAKNIISAIESADSVIAQELKSIIETTNQPCLVLALNGMKSFDLSAEVTNQIVAVLKRDGHDSTYLENLRPRFKQATSLVSLSNDNVRKELLKGTDVESIDLLLSRLSDHDEIIYEKVYSFFENRGMSIRVLAGESVRDVIDITARKYCGLGKPYKSILILFDEFGKYTEFATVRSQIAGSGALQEIFEAIQGNPGSTCFVGFIQFELSAYVQRIAPEYKNEILRYISRYQTADKLYLSVNLETLIASLIEKKDTDYLEETFDDSYALKESQEMMYNIKKWFPHAENFRAWNELDTFHQVIRKGCWPLAPCSTWLLFYLTTAGKHLQERSALALLSDVFKRINAQNMEISEEKWMIYPVELCSESLLEELISSEEAGQQGSITHSYKTVLSKHASRLSSTEKKTLQSVLLASKLGLVSQNQADAVSAFHALSSLELDIVEKNIERLHHEYNVIEWDDSFKAFDILGDAIPRTQFLAFLRQKVASIYDHKSKSSLFVSKAIEWCDYLGDLDCDFAEDNNIFTREWNYKASASSLDYLAQHVKIASDRWGSEFSVDESKGTVIYCYVEPSRSYDDAKNKVKNILKDATNQYKVKILPIIIIIMHDTNGKLGEEFAQYAVIQELAESDKLKFGNLVESQKEKLSRSIREQVSTMIKQRLYHTGLKSLGGQSRLSHVGKFLFSEIYRTPISFPFDGFNTSRGNAAKTCHELTLELLHGKLDHDSVIAKPVKVKNRAINVLRKNWKIFNTDGKISRRPKHPVISALTIKYDDELKNNHKLSIVSVIREICYPPFGANLASAGLFLGVYIAARHDKLIIFRNNERISISEWLAGGVFAGKFLNLSALKADDLMQLEESSSEWEEFLDEWENVDSYESRIEFLKRSDKLKKKIPLPPTLVYREQRFASLASDAAQKLMNIEKRIDSAWDNIEKAMQKKDSGIASKGTKEFKKVLDEMKSQSALWSDSKIAEVEKYYGEGRQYVQQYFASWLPWQTSRSDAPEVVGDYKHKMKLIGANFIEIGLKEESLEIEKQCKKAIRNAELIAKTKQLARDASSWLMEHSDSLGALDLLNDRTVRKSGEKLLACLKQVAKKSDQLDVKERCLEVESFLSELMEKEKRYEKRLINIWGTTIETSNDLSRVFLEIKDLLEVFHGIQDKEEELFVLRQSVVLLTECMQRLSNENLTWGQFTDLSMTLEKKCCEQIDQEKVPWEIDQVLSSFSKTIREKRCRRSSEWISSFLDSKKEIPSMSAIEGNQLYNRAANVPPYLTEEHVEQLTTISMTLENHLNNLSIEWLIEKFRELPKNRQHELLDRLSNLSGN